MSLQNILPSTLRESVLARSIAAYSSISWLLLQVVSTFISGLGLPDWVFTGFLVILLAGIPVLLLAARSAARRSDPAHENRPPLRLGKITFKRAALGGSVAIALWVSLVGAFMASWALGIGPAASLLAAGSIKTSDAVLLAEFENRTTDPLLGRTVAEAIRVDLSQSNIIRVVDPVDVKEALERMKKPADSPLDDATARELSLREGIAAVLEGEVSALGPATIITVRLVDARHGSVLAEYQERAREPAELLDAVDRLSGTLRNKIGEPLTKIRVEPPLAKVTTTSVEALRDYTKANIAHGEGKKSKAIELLRSALARDPQFPMAWRKLGVLLAEDDRLGAMTAYTRAYQLRDNLPERERGLTVASYMKNVANNLPEAMRAYQDVLDDYPDDETALTNLANLYTAFQQPEQAVALHQKVVGLRPRFAAFANLFNGQIRLGRLGEAQRTHELAAKLFPDQKKVKLQPIELAVARNDMKTADELVSKFVEENKGKPELANDLFLARYAWRRGRLEQAKSMFRARAEAAAGKGKYADAIEAMTSLVAIARVEDKPDEGRRLIAEALASYPLAKIDPAERPLLDIAEAYALTGDAEDASRYLALAEQQPFSEATLNYDQNARTRGLIALASGRAHEAVTILEKASHFGQCNTCLLYDLALALEADGQTQSAIATLQRYRDLAPRALGRGELLGFALLQMAQLQAKTGDMASAETSRRSLAELWQTGDPPLLALVGQSGKPVAAGATRATG